MTEARMTAGALTVRADEKRITVEAFGRTVTSESWFTLDIETMGRFTPDTMTASVVKEDPRLITVTHVSADGRVKVRSTVMEDRGDIRVCCAVSADWKTTPQVSFLRAEWINGLCTDGYAVRYPACVYPAPDGSEAFIRKSCADMPLSLLSEDGSGVSLYFDGGDHGPLRNDLLRTIGSEKSLREMRLKIRPNPAHHVMADVQIHAFTGGWESCFLHAREHAHRGFDASLFHRSDLNWMNGCTLGHFAFVYGEECYDYDTDTFRMDRVLDRGTRFGGWDYVVLWNQYPRLGLDERHIWDMNYEFPGGMDGLRGAVALAHERNVRVLLPYMPWDRDPRDSEYDIADKITRLLKESGADGLFMDTMNSVPPLYRKAADAAGEGKVLLVENTPPGLYDISVSQASWDQYQTPHAMPEANRLRFLFPEHVLYECARWHQGSEKDTDLKRAEFNGMRFIVWEDIFGVMLPFDDAQAERIRRRKEIFNRYADCMNGTAVPLLPTCEKSVYLNLFRGNGRAVAALYNASEEEFDGAAARIAGFAAAGVICGARRAEYEDGILYAAIPGREVALIELREEAR